MRNLSLTETTLADVGQTLVAQGYNIVPIKQGEKRPAFAGWQDSVATSENVGKWIANGFAEDGVGVLCANTPAVDLDILDPTIARAMSDYVRKTFGHAPERIGRDPKTMLIFRTDNPFCKQSSKRYKDPFGNTHQVEVLGQGQQFVGFAIHPDTRKPYYWPSLDLTGVAQSDLSSLTVAGARAIIAHFESIVPKDWEEVSVGPNRRSSKLHSENEINRVPSMLEMFKPPLNLTVAEVKRYLAAIPERAESHDDWIMVGLALHHQFSGSDEGLALWDEWSLHGLTYEAGETKKRWKSFGQNENRDLFTFATVIQWAKKEHSVPSQFIENYVYIIDGDKVCDLSKPPQHSVCGLTEFKNGTANIRHEVPASTRDNPEKTRLAPVHSAWFVHPERMTAQGVKFDPSEERLIRDEHDLIWVNEFYMPSFDPTASTDLPDVFANHMDYLFPIEIEREWFIDWMAFNLQRPGVRCKVTPLHISVAHGIGRGWVVELLARHLGYWNCTQTKMSVLAGQGSGGAFQDYLVDSLLCTIEEVFEGNGRYQVNDAIRDILTENRLEVNVKYGKKTTRDVFTNFFMMSNHTDALVLTEEDRRINVFRGPDTPREKAYYDELYAWLDTDGVAQLYNALLARDLTHFNWNRSMNTAARSAMIGNNRTRTESAFWDFMDAPPAKALTIKQISDEMVKLIEGEPMDTIVDRKQLTKLLKQHCCQWDGGRSIKIDGKSVRPWILVPGPELSSDEVRDEVTKVK